MLDCVLRVCVRSPKYARPHVPLHGAGYVIGAVEDFCDAHQLEISAERELLARQIDVIFPLSSVVLG